MKKKLLHHCRGSRMVDVIYATCWLPVDTMLCGGNENGQCPQKINWPEHSLPREIEAPTSRGSCYVSVGLAELSWAPHYGSQFSNARQFSSTVMHSRYRKSTRPSSLAVERKGMDFALDKKNDQSINENHPCRSYNNKKDILISEPQRQIMLFQISSASSLRDLFGTSLTFSEARR